MLIFSLTEGKHLLQSCLLQWLHDVIRGPGSPSLPSCPQRQLVPLWSQGGCRQKLEHQAFFLTFSGTESSPPRVEPEPFGKFNQVAPLFLHQLVGVTVTNQDLPLEPGQHPLGPEGDLREGRSAEELSCWVHCHLLPL